MKCVTRRLVGADLSRGRPKHGNRPARGTWTKCMTSSPRIKYRIIFHNADAYLLVENLGVPATTLSVSVAASNSATRPPPSIPLLLDSDTAQGTIDQRHPIPFPLQPLGRWANLILAPNPISQKSNDKDPKSRNKKKGVRRDRDSETKPANRPQSFLRCLPLLPAITDA